MDELWDRVRAGRHTVVLGASPGEPPPSAGVRLVRVRCDGPPTTLGPLGEARHKVEHLLGSPAPLLGEARDRVVKGLRRRLLGDVPPFEIEAGLVEIGNRLARSSDRPAALIFEAVDAADEATLTMLRRIMARSGWLKLSVVLAFRTTTPTGPAAALLETVRAVAGAESVLHIEGPHALSAPAAPARVEHHALPPDVRRVLRAGALVGSGFEADLVAALLEVDVIDVLDTLQRAADLGVPVEDLGDARFRLPEAMLDDLRASMLPSLMIAWHQRLAELLGGIDEDDEVFSFEDDVEPEAPEPFVATRRAPAVPPGERSYHQHLPHSLRPEPPEATLPEPPPAPVKDADRPLIEPATERRSGPGEWAYAEIFARPGEGAAPAHASAGEASPSAAADVSASSIRPRGEPPPRPPSASAAAPVSRGDDARAAAHLAAAGDLDASAERYHAAARQAAEHGAYARAFSYAEKAIAILDTLPISPRRRRLRARTLLELGRLEWQAAGPAASPTASAYEPAFTLTAALATLDAARAALTDDDPPELAAEIATVTAAVCYDVGDSAALTRALEELASASRLLLDAGDPTGAARLLNDQAAVYVRLGDPVQATHLLTESRRIFEERAPTDPVAALEMAETDHLFARIPLHVAARPGRESDALTMGLDHALAAERTYRALDAKRDLARVWETMGRLELRKGHLDRARERLTAAVEVEEAIGDLVGLARSTAALSELLAADGRFDDALTVLSDSVALNFEKGSPIGLAFNRRALAALEGAIEAAGERPAALADTRLRLHAAEDALGRMKLPGEHD